MRLFEYKKHESVIRCELWRQTFIRHGSVITLDESTTVISASEMTADFMHDIRKPYTSSQNVQRCWCISTSHRPAMNIRQKSGNNWPPVSRYRSRAHNTESSIDSYSKKYPIHSEMMISTWNTHSTASKCQSLNHSSHIMLKSQYKLLQSVFLITIKCSDT